MVSLSGWMRWRQFSWGLWINMETGCNIMWADGKSVNTKCRMTVADWRSIFLIAFDKFAAYFLEHLMAVTNAVKCSGSDRLMIAVCGNGFRMRKLMQIEFAGFRSNQDFIAGAGKWRNNSSENWFCHLIYRTMLISLNSNILGMGDNNVIYDGSESIEHWHSMQFLFIALTLP